MNKPGVFVIVSLASIAAWFFYNRAQDTSASVAAKIDRCVMEGDSDCIWPYVRTTISKTQFDKLVKSYVTPAFKGLGKSSQYVQDFGEKAHSYRYFGEPPNTYMLIINVAPNIGGPLAMNLVDDLVRQAMAARHKRPLQPSVSAFEIKAIRQDRAFLESVGIDGLAMDSPGSGWLTWEANLASAQKGLRKGILDR